MHETQVTDRKPKRPRQVRAEADWCFWPARSCAMDVTKWFAC